MKPTTKLRQLLASGEVVQAGGVADAGQGRLAESVGFPAIYISGAYLNHTRGYPDGTLTLSEIAARIREVTARVDAPVVADADEGFGGTLKVARTIREFEAAGAAALHLEDFATKKHGVPIPVADMVRNLKIMQDCRRDPDFTIIARTDAMAPWRDGVRTDPKGCAQDAYERLCAYAEAGADLLMPLYASNEWLLEWGPKLPKPLSTLAGAPKSWGGKVQAPPPDLTLDGFKSANVRLLIYSTNMLVRTHRFMKQQYATWLAEGGFHATLEDEEDRAEANRLIGLAEKTAFLDKFGE